MDTCNIDIAGHFLASCVRVSVCAASQEWLLVWERRSLSLAESDTFCKLVGTIIVKKIKSFKVSLKHN